MKSVLRFILVGGGSLATTICCFSAGPAGAMLNPGGLGASGSDGGPYGFTYVACSTNNDVGYPNVNVEAPAATLAIVWQGHFQCFLSGDANALPSITMTSTLTNAANGKVESSGTASCSSADGPCWTITTQGSLPVVVPDSEHIFTVQLTAVAPNGLDWGVPDDSPDAATCSGYGTPTMYCTMSETFVADIGTATATLLTPTGTFATVVKAASSAQAVIEAAGLK